jgi:hypothetical protein
MPHRLRRFEPAVMPIKSQQKSITTGPITLGRHIDHITGRIITAPITFHITITAVGVSIAGAICIAYGEVTQASERV